MRLSLMQWAAVAVAASSLLVVGVEGVASAAEITLASCPKAGGGDQASRAFYLRDFPATNLGRVTVYLLGSDGYHVALKATEDTFDGPVIGTASADVDHPSFDPVVFDFHGVSTRVGHIIAFSLTSVADGGGALYLDTGIGPCPAVEETEGVTPPLSQNRRDSVGLIVTTYGPELHAVTPSSGPIAGRTAVSVAADFVGTDSRISFGGQSVGATIPDGGTGEGGVFTTTTSAHAQGPVDIVIEVSYANDAGVDAGASATLTGGFTYTAAVPDDGGVIGSDGGSMGKDAGAASDGGSDNPGNGDVADGMSDDSGCGCSVPGVATSSGSAGLLLVALGAIFRRRRRSGK